MQWIRTLELLVSDALGGRSYKSESIKTKEKENNDAVGDKSFNIWHPEKSLILDSLGLSYHRAFLFHYLLTRISPAISYFIS